VHRLRSVAKDDGGVIFIDSPTGHWVPRHLQAHRPDLAMRLLGYWKR
jgi:hypothetical protein